MDNSHSQLFIENTLRDNHLTSIIFYGIYEIKATFRLEIVFDVEIVF